MKTDAELVSEILAGNTGQYVELLSRYRARFGRYARHMLGNKEDAEEALQDTFVRAFRSLKTCQTPTNFEGWCFKILMNRCRTESKKWQHRESKFVYDEGKVLAHPKRDSMEMRVWRAEIYHALDKLDENRREAFLLKHVEEMEYDEMAKLTGVSVSALKMRVKRAREQLQKELEGVINV
jgi:RNA polymerase sigma-70 factor (ECF subfamily)